MWALLATGDVVHTNLDSLSLSGTRLSRHQNGLIAVIESKSLVCESRSFVDMGLHRSTRVTFRVFPDQNSSISVANLLGVDLGEPLERVDSDDNITRSGVWLSTGVTILKIVQDGGLLLREEC